MIGSGGTPARAARIAGVACALLLVAGCAGFTESTRSPPGVDVPEPGAQGASVGARPAASAPPARTYPSRATAYPAATTPPRPSAQATPAAPAGAGAASPSPLPGVSPAPAATAPAGALPIPAAGAAAGEDSFTIESAPAQGGAAAGATPPGGAIDVQAPPPSANAAVNTLLAQAATERRGGNLEAAIAAAERALRIAPADPAVYCELATLRLEHGDYAQAEQLARKGLSYQPDAELAQRLNAIIARARRGATG